MEKTVDDAVMQDQSIDTEGASVGMFTGFVLLSSAEWDKEKLKADLKAQWGIEAVEVNEPDEEPDDTSLIFNIGEDMVIVALMPAPIPDNEAELCAENNYLWPEAVAVTGTHQAHLLVSVLGEKGALLDRGKLYVKVMASCCEAANAIGVFTSGVVFEPYFYKRTALVMEDGELPLLNWIWFGMYRNDEGVCAYTYGMDVFGKDEMEILDAKDEPAEVRGFLMNLTDYVLGQDVTLRDGETIGFSAEDIHRITRSEGISLSGMTLKIDYAPEPTAEKTGLGKKLGGLFNKSRS